MPSCTVMLGVYPVSIVRQCTGHCSTQQLHTTHLRRSMLHVFSSLTTQIASVGHFLMHIPQEMHRAGSIETRPRERIVFFAGTEGYLLVEGLRSVVRIAVFAISKYPISLTSPRTQCRDRYSARSLERRQVHIRPASSRVEGDL